MRRSLLVFLIAILAAACAEDPAPTTPADDGPTPLDETRLGVYESLARELVSGEEITWNKIVIVTELCENAAEPAEPKGCDDALSPAEQDALARRLGDLGTEISFVADPTPLYDDDWLSGIPEMVVLRLGTISPNGEGVRVGGSYGCGGLCASGTTYLLEERAGGWEVVGTSGTAWIA